MSSIRAVLFDLDDTLFDHSYCVAHSMELLRGDHACLQVKSLDEILVEHTRVLDLMHVDVLAGRLSMDQARVDRMREIFRFCGSEISDEIALESAELHRQRYRSARRAVPGAHELLTAIRADIKIGIVTNNLTDEQRAKLDVCALSPFVDVLVTPEECGGFAKPAQEIFKAALERLECAPEESIMVGDSWSADVIGAMNAGIPAVWFNRRGLPRPGKCFAEISELEQFLILDERSRGVFNHKLLEPRRKELRRKGTAAEAVLWKLLQKRQVMGKKFRRQHSIGPYIVDFYCPECRVVVELDGAPHYGIIAGDYDAERTRYLEQYGIQVVRFENRLLYENPEMVLETIKQTLLNR